jgi:hypothetical protein
MSWKLAGRVSVPLARLIVTHVVFQRLALRLQRSFVKFGQFVS